MSRLRSLMSWKAKRVSANSGTQRMSRTSRRVKPMLPAPTMAIFKVMPSR